MPNHEPTPDPDEFGQAPNPHDTPDDIIKDGPNFKFPFILPPSFFEVPDESLYNKPVEPVIKPEEVEERKPYPSRDGWRADFVPADDPADRVIDPKKKGSIGGYDIVESTTTFADVGGNTQAKEVLEEIANQFENPELYEKWDVPVPRGVLLHGDPGTGKTMIAKAFANRADAAFVEVPVAALRSKWYGETPKKLKAIYDEAAKHDGRVVLFFDEIDSLLGSREELSPSNPDAKLVNAALQALDGMQSSPNVMTLGATNYPDKLDPAAIRPGRFDRKVPVELPDRQACGEIAAKQLLSAEKSAQRILVEDDLDIAEVSGYLDGLSGADIAEVVNRVKRTMAQTERSKQGQIEIDGVEAVSFEEESDDIKITTDDIIATAINYRLSG